MPRDLRPVFQSPPDESDEPDQARRRRKEALRHRLLRMSLSSTQKIAAAVLVPVVIAGLTALVLKLVNRSSAEAGGGYRAAVTFDYPEGQKFALPTALTDATGAAPLLAGFPSGGPVAGMTGFLSQHGGAAVDQLRSI